MRDLVRGMFNKYSLDNGIRVVTYRMPEMKSVSVGLWVGTGSRNENTENNGVSHFIEHLLFKGTKMRSARKIAEIFDSIGGQINAFTGKEATCFYSKTLGEYLDLSMDVLSDIFFNSVFDSKELELEKQVILEEIHMYEDAPEEIVHELATKMTWKKSLGYSILGSEETVSNLTRDDVINYMNDNYTSNRLVISVAGNFEENMLKRLINKYFSKWNSNFSEMSFEKNSFHSGKMIYNKDTEQTHFCISFPGVCADSKLVYPALAFNNILGGGMSSRLFQEIREKRGLAYSVYSYLTSYMKEGILTIYGGVNPGNFNEVYELIYKEIDKLVKRGPTKKEVKNAKEQLKGNFLLGFENTASVMSYAGKSELLWNRIETVDEVIEKIERIDDDNIESVKNLIFGRKKSALTVVCDEKREDFSGEGTKN